MPLHIKHTVEAEGKFVNYPADLAGGRTNNGFTDLRGHPELVQSIQEAWQSPALTSLLVSLASPDSTFFSVGCELGDHARSTDWHAGGYIEVACSNLCAAEGGLPWLKELGRRISQDGNAVSGSRHWLIESFEAPLGVEEIGGPPEPVVSFTFHLHVIEPDRETALAAREELFTVIRKAAESEFVPVSNEGTLPGAVTDQDVVAFLSLYQLSEVPLYLDFEDKGYEADFCHVSAKHAAHTNGGRRVHGWAIWQFEGMVLGEFHSVWEKPDGTLVDVTPPKFGSPQILFVADPSLSIINYGTFQALYCDRSSDAKNPYWFRGKPHGEAEWGMPNDMPGLVRYCKALGLPDTSMV